MFGRLTITLTTAQLHSDSASKTCRATGQTAIWGRRGFSNGQLLEDRDIKVCFLQLLNKTWFPLSTSCVGLHKAKAISWKAKQTIFPVNSWHREHACCCFSQGEAALERTTSSPNICLVQLSPNSCRSCTSLSLSEDLGVYFTGTSWISRLKSKLQILCISAGWCKLNFWHNRHRLHIIWGKIRVFELCVLSQGSPVSCVDTGSFLLPFHTRHYDVIYQLQPREEF